MSVVKWTTQPQGARYQPLFSPAFLSFSSLLNNLGRLLQTSHTTPTSLKRRQCTAWSLWQCEQSVKPMPHQRSCTGHAVLPSTTQRMMLDITTKRLQCRLGSLVLPVGSQAGKGNTAQCCRVLGVGQDLTTCLTFSHGWAFAGLQAHPASL